MPWWTYGGAEGDCDLSRPSGRHRNRDYIADIGYRAEDGSWLSLARSAPVRVDTVLAQGGGVSPALGLAGAAVGAGAAVAMAPTDRSSTNRDPH